MSHLKIRRQVNYWMLQQQRLPYQGSMLTTIIHTIAMQGQSQGFNVVIKLKIAHGLNHIFSSDGFALVTVAMIISFGCYEAYELRDTFLDGHFGVISYFEMARKDLAHDSDDVRYWYKSVLLPDGAFRILSIGINCLLEMCRQSSFRLCSLNTKSTYYFDKRDGHCEYRLIELI